MSLERLVAAWRRPRNTAELEEWQRLERALNARLLEEGEGPLPSFSVAVEKSLNRSSSRKTSSSRGQSSRNGRHYPRSALAEHAQNTLEISYLPVVLVVCTVGILLLGAGWAGYELYRIYDRVAHKMRRPTYYNAEAKRRAERLERQRSESHRIRHRKSFLVPPLPEEIREAWKCAHKRGNVREKLQLGAMLSRLEASVDNGLIQDLSGTIVGRKSGVKGWLAVHCPELLTKYSTLMHYKAVSDRQERVCGIADPCPAEVLLAEPDGADDTTITVGTIPKSRCHDADSATECSDITITVGLESEKKKVKFRGIREEYGETEVKQFAGVMDIGRRRARNLWEEARKAQMPPSLFAFDDLLYAKLGLVRERRLHAVPRRPKTRR